MSPRERFVADKGILKLMCNVDVHSDIAAYVQIENSVRFAIASGLLKGGSQLPSVRELSETLALNANTIAKAYRDLEIMGFLYTRRGMGVFVKPGMESQCKKSIAKEMVKRLYEVVSEAKAAGFSLEKINAVCNKSFPLTDAAYGEVPPSIRSLASKE